jgi:hypothetical protein
LGDRKAPDFFFFRLLNLFGVDFFFQFTNTVLREMLRLFVMAAGVLEWGIFGEWSLAICCSLC